MAALDREAIVAALFDRLQARCPDIRAWSRRWVPPDTAVRRVQPFGVLVCDSQTPTNAVGLPVLWEIGLQLVVYVTTTQEDETPDAKLNLIIQQVEDALVLGTEEDPDLEAGDERFWAFAGALVRCWISGVVEMVPGELTGQGVAVIPLSVLAYAA